MSVKKVEKAGLVFNPDLKSKDATIKDDIITMSKDCTEQQWKEQQDINNIIKQYVTYNNGYVPVEDIFSDASNFMDCSEFPKDLQGAFDRMTEARESFVQNVPASIREKFNNNAFDFYQFTSNPKNQSAVAKMFAEEKNHSVPTADQVVEAQRSVVVGDDKKE